MAEEQNNMFSEEIEALNKLRTSVFEKLDKSGSLNRPSAGMAASTFDMFITTAYLWLTQAAYFAAMGGASNIEKVVTDASDNGKIITMPVGDADGPQA